MPSKYEAPSEDMQAHPMLGDPDLYRYAGFISEAVFGRGPGHQRFGYDLACFILDVEARIYGNRKRVEKANNDPHVWARKRKIVARVSPGVDLPPTPPTAETVRKWRNRWLDPTTPADQPPVTLRDFQNLVIERGVQRARDFGHFAPGVEPDFADPDPRHLLTADGTYLRQYSSARVVTDHEGNRHLIGSRAKSEKTARIQSRFDEVTKNDRKVSGVNHVVALTRTRYGRVVLGVEQAPGGESHAALVLFEHIIAATGDGLHNVVYDKGFTGWPVDWLMAEHGVNVISHLEAAKADSEEHEKARLEATEALKRSGLFARVGKSSAITKAVAQARIDAMFNAAALLTATKQGRPTGLGLPMGKSEYLNVNTQLAKVDSKHYHYDTISHELPDGTNCTHDLAVDDRAVWETTFTEGQLVKSQRALSVGSRRRRRTSGAWSMHTHYQVTCILTGDILPFDITWDPEHRRGKPKKRAKRTSKELGAHASRPLARCDGKFGKIYGLRNDSESWFSWFKGRLLEDKRAASLHLHHQLLDVIYGGIITNALALRVSRLTER